MSELKLRPLKCERLQESVTHLPDRVGASRANRSPPLRNGEGLRSPLALQRAAASAKKPVRLGAGTAVACPYTGANAATALHKMRRLRRLKVYVAFGRNAG